MVKVIFFYQCLYPIEYLSLHEDQEFWNNSSTASLLAHNRKTENNTVCACCRMHVALDNYVDRDDTDNCSVWIYDI